MDIFSLNSINASSILEAAFKKCGLYSSGMGLSGDETATALSSLNVILKSIQNKYPFVNKQVEHMIPLKQSYNVIGVDGYEYKCIKGHRAINTFETDGGLLSYGSKVYNKTENNYVVYEVASGVPIGRIPSTTWPTDKDYYYTDSYTGLNLYPVSDLADYAYSVRPGSDTSELTNVYFEKQDTKWDLVATKTYVAGDYVAVRPRDLTRTILFKCHTSFSYDTAAPGMDYAGWLAFAFEQTNPMPYESETYYNAYDKINIPDSFTDIKNVYVVDTSNNTTCKLDKVSQECMLNKYDRASTGTKPLCYSTMRISNKMYLLLYPLISTTSDYNTLKIEGILKFKNIDSSSEVLDIPDEFVRMIELELAQDMGMTYGIDSMSLSLITSKLGEAQYDVELKFKHSIDDFDSLGGY